VSCKDMSEPYTLQFTFPRCISNDTMLLYIRNQTSDFRKFKPRPGTVKASIILEVE
jgi:hypothetical protein